MPSDFEVSSTDFSINWSPASETEEILQNVRFILGTVGGTVPLARWLGINRTMIDGPVTKQRAALMMGAVRALQRGEDRVTVREVYIDDLDAANGQFSPRVRIAL
jgi:phage baseplate assembly protein W